MSLHKLILNNLQTLPLSLAELQTVTQVSLPTLRKAIQELTDGRWIRVTGQSESSGGRPAMLFGLDESYHVIVSIHIQLPGIRLITSNLSGKIIDERVVFPNSVPRPHEAIQEVERYLENIQSQFSDRSIIGIGIATPGYIDPETGMILSIERVTGWQNFPIGDQLRDFSGLPVYIANDVDCMALAEFQHNHTSLDNNLMYVGFDEGVKCSMFLNGQLYKGAFGNVGLVIGEFFQSATDEDSHDLLTIQGLNTYFEETMRGLDQQQLAHYEPIITITDQRLRLQSIFEYSVKGDPICNNCVNKLVEALVKSIVVTTYLIHPDMIVVGGILSTAPTEIYQQIETAVYTALPSLFANHLIIRQAILNQSNRAAIGATHHFLQTYLDDPITDPLLSFTV